MKNLLILVAVLALAVPVASFAQTTTVGGCMTVTPGNELLCVYQRLLELTDRVTRLEARIAKLEAGGGTIPQPVPYPTPVPLPTPVCDSVTGTCTIRQGGSTSPASAGTATAVPTAVGSGQLPADQVVAIQKFLKAEGSFAYPTATGYFGPITQEALRSFQAKASIPVTGVVDGATVEKMSQLAPAIAPSLSASIQQVKPVQ